MKIKIKNFRSFKDMEYIDIKPITILIGRNSAGKSSFLRTFPMLKQSFEERTRSPILLYGNYIDFGSYQDIKPNFIENNMDDNYELGFIFDKNIFIDINRYSMRKTLERITYGSKEFFDIELILSNGNSIPITFEYAISFRPLVYFLTMVNKE